MGYYISTFSLSGLSCKSFLTLNNNWYTIETCRRLNKVTGNCLLTGIVRTSMEHHISTSNLNRLSWKSFLYSKQTIDTMMKLIDVLTSFLELFTDWNRSYVNGTLYFNHPLKQIIVKVIPSQ